jgi:hypothetical protein
MPARVIKAIDLPAEIPYIVKGNRASLKDAKHVNEPLIKPLGQMLSG